MQRSIVGDLNVFLVGQVLAPDLDGPALVIGAQHDPAVEERQRVLLLVRQQVGTGVVLRRVFGGQAHADAQAVTDRAIEVDGAGGRPFGSERSARTRQQRQLREIARRRHVGGGEVAVFRVRIGDAALEAQALDRGEPQEVGVDAARGQLGDRLHHEGGAEEGVELEVGERLIEIGRVQQDRPVEQGGLDAGFIAVDHFGREQQRGRRRDAVLNPVEVVAEALVAAGVRAIDHDLGADAVRRLDRAAQLAVVVIFGDRAVFKGAVRPRQADPADDGRGIGPQNGTDSAGIGQGGVAGIAVAVDVVLDAVEALVILGVTQTQGDIERVGDVPAVVREDGERGRSLLIGIAIALTDDEADAAATGGTTGGQAGPQSAGRLADCRIAADGAGADREGRATAGERGAEQEGQEGRVVRAVVPAVGAVDVFLGGEQTHQPVNLFGRAGEAEFLRQVLDLVAVLTVVLTIDDVSAGVVDIHPEGGPPVAGRRHRGQGRAAEAFQIDIDLERNALVLDLLAGIAVGIGRARERQRAQACGV